MTRCNITGLLLALLLALRLPAGAADPTTTLVSANPTTEFQQSPPEGSGTTEAGPPFPAALGQAAVELPQITDIQRQAPVLGNGDLLGLLWERNETLCLRLSKNDIWDARVDTSQDVPLQRKGGQARLFSHESAPVPLSAPFLRRALGIRRDFTERVNHQAHGPHLSCGR